jgi:hypothetical protein
MACLSGVDDQDLFRVASVYVLGLAFSPGEFLIGTMGADQCFDLLVACHESLVLRLKELVTGAVDFLRKFRCHRTAITNEIVW